MELPHPRPFGTQGKRETHDFLSLCSLVQQDPRPSQGGFLKTHDFLHPLERLGNNIAKEEDEVEVMTIGNLPPPAPFPSVEHLLPGGIGTYSISYINQRVSKPDISTFRMAQASNMDQNEENSNCSYSGNSFTVWEESSVKKGKTGKENIGEDRHSAREAGMKIGGQWISSGQQSHSYSKNDHRSDTFSALSSTPSSSAQKNQSFIDMIKYAKNGQEEEDGDKFFIKKELSPHTKSELTVKIDRKSTDQKANTPRSKHSATEQRRRSKINDRFQTLRRLTPSSDQKRDKASFLLEVIEYIQFLQEKVQKYEGSCHGQNLEAPTLNPCTTSKRNAEDFQDQYRGTNSGFSPVLMFPVKFENNKEIPNIPRAVQNPAESDISVATTFKTVDKSPVVSKTGSFPVPLQSSIFHPGGSSGAKLCPRLASDNETTKSQSSYQLWKSRSCTNECTLAIDKMKEWELDIESGTINVSSSYSKGLLNTLTQALQNSGVDLSQTSISVQIDIGKQANGRLNSSPSTVKDDEVPCGNQARFRVASSEEPERTLKKLKTGRSSS